MKPRRASPLARSPGSCSRRFGCEITSHVTGIGEVVVPARHACDIRRSAERWHREAPLRCVDPALEKEMIGAIDAAKEAGDTLGGSFEVIVRNVPVGLGSYVQWDRKLDGRLAQALMSIPAIKASAIGVGVEPRGGPARACTTRSSPTRRPPARVTVLTRPTNRAGGLEGGVTNGEEVRVTGYMKPIATLMKPLRSVDLTTLEEAPAAIERSDVCAVPAAAVVGEAMVALVLADAAARALRRRFDGRASRRASRDTGSAHSRPRVAPPQPPREPDHAASHSPARGLDPDRAGAAR